MENVSQTGIYERDLIHRIYPKELEMKDTIDTVVSDSYINLKVDINSKVNLFIKLYGNAMTFHSVFSTFLSSMARSFEHQRIEIPYQSQTLYQSLL